MAMVNSTIPTNGPILGPASFIFVYDRGGMIEIPVGRMALEAQKSAIVAEQQLQNDVDAIKQYNDSLGEINDRVLPVLNDVSGLALGPNPPAWQKWFVDLVGYQLYQLRASESPTVIEEVPLAYQPQPIPLNTFIGPIDVRRASCFGPVLWFERSRASSPSNRSRSGIRS